MKRFALSLFVLVLSILLCGCGKSEAVKAAETAIAAIGEVTPESGEAIAQAEKLYGILTDSEKSKIDNRLDLVEAREAFDALQGKIIYENAKSAYEKLNEVAGMCENGMDDIYGAWYFGIYEAEDTSTRYESTLYTSFAKRTPNLTSHMLEDAGKALGLSTLDIKYSWQNCLLVAEMAIAMNGDYENIEQLMQEAQDILNELTKSYSDYEYYPKLKDYYSSVSSYAEFFMSPSGSFKQLSDTINNYETSIRTYQSDVGFLFSK